ncbi:calcium-binding protein [Pseudaestuariivita atlantica]|uniref:Peptidase M10 serralysin C-terminal domain-containing protein n=1 Tax=Pseudaestuariivita atlantica TaxID=1317121 RepID=A0A0L1JMF4_9RHOB|nr:calcium-binding protein [Pseudaestuariivita atlantica]KNG92917.1 hypothetical protein ATO11_15820 [Pseudaestuariivita atlantica]
MVITGTTGNDTLEGTSGDDTINPLSSDGYDQLIGTTGDDLYLFADAVDGRVIELTYFNLPFGIDAVIDLPGRTAIVDKGPDGIDTLQDLNRVTALDMFDIFILVGSRGRDTYDVTLSPGSMFWVAPLGGINDVTVTFADNSVFVISYSTASRETEFDIADGRIFSDGFVTLSLGPAQPGSILWVIGGIFNDEFIGSAMDEYFSPDVGADTIDGGAGNDIVRYDGGLPASLVADLAAGSVTVTGSDGLVDVQQLTSIEGLIGAFEGDSVTGSARDDYVEGRGGDDTLIGLDGDDTLYGGLGNDVLDGGAGDDLFRTDTFEDGATTTIRPGTGTNTLEYFDTLEVDLDAIVFDPATGVMEFRSAYGQVTQVDTATGTLDYVQFVDLFDLSPGNRYQVVTDVAQATQVAIALAGTDGNDDVVIPDAATLGGPAPDGTDLGLLFFNGGDDRVTLSDDFLHIAIMGEGDDTGIGGSGNDRMQGDAGQDSLLGNAGDDTLLGDDGLDTLDGGTGNDALLGGAGNDTALGATGQDSLFGDDGDDLLDGGEDDDIVSGNAGNDTLMGGAGDDTLFGEAGADRFEGGDGFDLVDHSVDGDGRILVDLQTDVSGAGFARFYDHGAAEGDTYAGIEHVIGGTAADNLRGDGAANRLEGGGVSDRLYGRAGDDTLDGGAGADAMYGNLGADVMTGGTGDVRDRFIYFQANETGVGAGNRDIITDFVSGEDRIEISRIDADITQGFKQRFEFIGGLDFTGRAGQLRFEIDAGTTLVQADRDGDGIADFEIELTGELLLTRDDFLI